MKTISLILTALFLTFSLSVLAESSKRVNKRQRIQKARINQGKRSGELSRKERKNLRAGQRKINRTERRAMKNGELNNREENKLERMQDRQNRKIRRKKNNDRSSEK